jgi:hypothetical protein
LIQCGPGRPGARFFSASSKAAFGRLSLLDGTVDLTDLLALLNNWGVCTQDCAQWACPGDINFDCQVSVLDLLALLTSWGACG